jgi:hypothetical protein
LVVEGVLERALNGNWVDAQGGLACNRTRRRSPGFSRVAIDPKNDRGCGSRLSGKSLGRQF